MAVARPLKFVRHQVGLYKSPPAVWIHYSLARLICSSCIRCDSEVITPFTNCKARFAALNLHILRDKVGIAGTIKREKEQYLYALKHSINATSRFGRISFPVSLHGWEMVSEIAPVAIQVCSRHNVVGHAIPIGDGIDWASGILVTRVAWRPIDPYLWAIPLLE